MTLLTKWPPGGHIVFWRVPGSNFSFTLNINSKLQWHNTYVYGGSLLIFSDVIFEMVSGLCRRHGFWQRNSSLLWNFSFKFHVHVVCGCLQKPNNFQLCCFQNICLAAILHFSVMDFNFNLALNIKSMLQQHITDIYSLLIFSDVTFKMAAQWPY